MSNVVKFPGRASVADALRDAAQMRMSDVIVIGYDADTGGLIMLPSDMTRKDALWLVESAKMSILDFRE